MMGGTHIASSQPPYEFKGGAYIDVYGCDLSCRLATSSRPSSARAVHGQNTVILEV